MTEQSAAGDDASAVLVGAAGDFAREALRLRTKAQREYAELMLATLSKIALDDKAGAVQVSAARELLDQVLGRPMAPPEAPARQGADMSGMVAAGSSLDEKLARILAARTDGIAGKSDTGGSGGS